MALQAGQFQALANKFMNSTFSAFKKTLIMRTADAPVYGTPQTYTTESGFGIELSIEYSKYKSDLIELGDIVIFTNASDWTTNPQLSGVDVVFDGVNYQIIMTEKDADNAAYFLTVRRK